MLQYKRKIRSLSDQIIQQVMQIVTTEKNIGRPFFEIRHEILFQSQWLIYVVANHGESIVSNIDIGLEASVHGCATVQVCEVLLCGIVYQGKSERCLTLVKQRVHSMVRKANAFLPPVAQRPQALEPRPHEGRISLPLIIRTLCMVAQYKVSQ